MKCNVPGLYGINDSKLIGFVLACSRVAITFQEAQEWLFYMIEKYNDLPPYLYALTTTTDWESFEEGIEFSTYSGLTSEEINAVLGISYVRGIVTEDGTFNVSKRTCLNALKRNPHIAKRFQEVFPFLHFEPPG